mmetsp:Transcript_25439/g.95870  ORF Transcript_25439/g.95870 Transcript_25439/m.95870 type:complete len:200 (-) Transcript_25439:2300-2899(-)
MDTACGLGPGSGSPLWATCTATSTAFSSSSSATGPPPRRTSTFSTGTSSTAAPAQSRWCSPSSECCSSTGPGACPLGAETTRPRTRTRCTAAGAGATATTSASISIATPSTATTTAPRFTPRAWRSSTRSRCSTPSTRQLRIARPLLCTAGCSWSRPSPLRCFNGSTASGPFLLAAPAWTTASLSRRCGPTLGRCVEPA